MPEIDPTQLPEREVYKLMSGAIVPRPIAWVSTISADGVPNLAPFSFFNAVCEDPPTLLFTTSIRNADAQPKDTYHNIVATGEFVVNFVTEALAEAMNITAVEAPPHVNEFERAGLTAAPSLRVRPPYVAESPIQFECRLSQIVTIGEGVGGGYVIFGTLVHMRIDDSVYRSNNYIDIEAYQPLGRLAGMDYARVTNRFALQRPPSELPGA